MKPTRSLFLILALASCSTELGVAPRLACATADDDGACPVEGEPLRCDVALVYGQKDAYLERGGRDHPAFPPHTSTKLEISCPPAIADLSDMRENDNHGSSFEDVDAQGRLLLDEVGAVTTSVPVDKLGALKMQFAGCECDTAFLSLDRLDGLGALIAALRTSIPAMACLQSSPALVTSLRADLADPLTADKALQLAIDVSAAPCTTGDWAAVFAQAIRGAGAGFHVCNNDAQLETAWFRDVQSWATDASGDPPACNQFAANCRGPAIYFTP